MAGSLHLSEHGNSVAVLTFDQPGSRANVLGSEMWDELDIVLDSLIARDNLQGLILASAKPGIFIAGADLKLLATAPAPNDPAVRAFIEQGLRVLAKLESVPFPTCAAIDGATLGGGLELALACDLRVCGTNDKVKLGLPETTLGLIPGWGGTQRLPRVLVMNGLHSAAKLLTTGQSLTALEAKAVGLVDEVVASESLLDQAAYYVLRTDREDRRSAKAQPLSGCAPRLNLDVDLGTAAREAVRVICEGATLPLKQAIALETEAFMQLAGSEESKRLIAAFFARKK
jgi:enoyl-CoA hydratase/carnithine racemase